MKISRYILAIFFGSIMIITSSCGKANTKYKEAVKYMNEGKYEKSISAFKAAISENSERADYYIGYGMALNFTEKYEDAIKEFDKAFQDVENKISKENNKQLYYGKAIAYYGLNDYEKAINACDKAIKIEQLENLNQRINLLKAAAMQLSGDKDGAFNVYSTILKDDKECKTAYFKRAELYIMSNEYDSACRDYNKIIELDAEDYDAYFGLYKVYTIKEDEKSAKAILEKIISKKDTKDDKNLLMQQGRAYYYLADYENAAAKLEEAVKNGSKTAIYYQGMIKMSKKDYKAAIELFEKYLKDNSDIEIPEVYNQLAGCCIEIEKYDEAQEYISKGLALGNTSASRLLQKNQIILYEKTDKLLQAKNAAKKYVKAYKDDKEMTKELKFIKTKIAIKKQLKNGEKNE